MSSGDPEYVDLVFRTLKAEEAKQQAKEVNTLLSKMTDEQKANALEAGKAAEKSAAAQAAASQKAADAQRALKDQLSESRQKSIALSSAISAAIDIYRTLVEVARSVGAAISNIAERNGALKSSMTDLRSAAEGLADNFARGAAEGGLFDRMIRALTQSIEASGPAARAAMGGIEAFLGVLNQALAGITRLPRGLIHEISGGRWGGWDAPGSRVGNEESFSRWAGRQRGYDAERAAAELDAEVAGWLDVNEGVGGQNLYNAPTGPRRRRGGGGGGGNDALALIAESERIIDQEMVAAKDKIEDLRVSQHERELDRIRLESERWAALNSQRVAELEQQDELSNRMKEAEIARIDELVQKNIEEEQNQNQRRQKRIADFTSYGQAFVSVGNTIGSVFGNLAAREEEGSKEAERYGKIQGGIMAAMSFIQSVIEYAQGIASIAKYDYVAAAAHFAAGIAFDVAGGMAIAQLGGDATPGAVATGGGGTYVPAEAPRDRDTEGTAGMNIQIITMGGSSARLGQEMQRAERELSRSGVDAPMLGGGAWS